MSDQAVGIPDVRLRSNQRCDGGQHILDIDLRFNDRLLQISRVLDSEPPTESAYRMAVSGMLRALAAVIERPHGA